MIDDASNSKDYSLQREILERRKLQDLTKNELSAILSKQEEALLKALRGIKYGQVTIYLDAGQPVRIEKIKESIKL